jgi:mRNA-degrading endonuclease toxin of MazEF toxin-antitoxin module
MSALPPHLKEKGQILADQIRALDFRARGSSFAGRVGDATLRDISDLVFELLEGA